ncbi:MAG: hypothetical protein ACLUKQ_01225 [Peptococcaceae bacterium]
MKRWMKKFAAVVATAAMVCSVGMPAFAVEMSELEQKAIATEKVNAFVQDKEVFVEAMNQVANKEADIVTNADLDDRIEVRELQIGNGISIVNTRTFSTRESTRVVDDSYGLFYMGMEGAGGTITAQYVYSYAKIDSPNQMTTLIHSASGYASGLNNYQLVNTVPRWDTVASYTPSASVKFNMKQQLTGGAWMDCSYEHTCQFDKYGGANMSWF